MHRLLFLLTLTVSLIGTVAAERVAAEEVDLELVLLADASRSIDDAEIRFQRQGYVTAITDPAVLAAIRSGYRQRIAVTYVEWGDETSQDIVVPWTIIEGKDSAGKFAADLMAAPRRATGPNAIGSALAFAHAMTETNDLNGTRKVIDFSADSAYTFGGIPIVQARAMALAAGTVINGLAILCRDADCGGRPVDYDLEDAFASFITGGPGSFVITADGRDRFATAVRRKLLLEIAGAPVTETSRTARLRRR